MLPKKPTMKLNSQENTQYKSNTKQVSTMHRETSTFYFNSLLSWLCTRTLQTIQQNETGWMGGGSNASGGKVFCPQPASCTMGTGSIP